MATCLEEPPGPWGYRIVRATGGKGPIDPMEQFDFQSGPWHPGEERRADNKARVLAEFEHAYDAYLDQMEAQSIQLGGMRRQAKYTPDHFVWLVRYQVLEHSYRLVARDVGVDRKAVKRGIENAANRVGMALRPSTSGRRPVKSSP